MDDSIAKLNVRRFSASTAGLRVAVPKTPAERMKQVTALGRRGRALKRAAHGRNVGSDRAR
jgi:hypothetical protein